LRWSQTDKKEVLVKELEEQGVLVDALEEAVNRKVDLFDLICHVAYDQPPLTRKERADNVKKNVITLQNMENKPGKYLKPCWINMLMKELLILRKHGSFKGKTI